MLFTNVADERRRGHDGSEPEILRATCSWNDLSCQHHQQGTTSNVLARCAKIFFLFFWKATLYNYSGLVIHLRTAEAGPDLACTLVALVVVLLLREGNWAGGKRARDPMSLGA